jgi:hypothetical protein
MLVADRVEELTSSTGTGTLNLSGTVRDGYQAFVDAFSNGDVVPYVLEEGTDWEVGIGTFTTGTPNTLSRTTVLASSNANAAVDFTAAPLAFVGYPAAYHYLPPNFTAGSILFAGTGGIFAQDNANLFWNDSTNKLGIGTTSPDSMVHIHSGSAGTVTANANTVLTLESSGGTTYLSMLTPNTGTAGLVFGDPDSNTVGSIAYNHNTDVLAITAGSTQRFFVFADGVVIGTGAPDSLLHIYGGSAGSVSAFSGTLMTIEDDSPAYYSILTPNNTQGGLICGDPDDNDVGSIIYSHVTNSWTVSVSATQGLYLTTTGLLIGTGSTAPDSKLHVFNGSAGTVTALANTVVTVENSTTAYLSFLSPNNVTVGLLFGDADDNDVGSILYNHSSNLLTFTVAATAFGYLNTTGLGVGTGAAASARIHSKVGSTDAIPCLELEQDDADKPFIEFDATEAASVANPISTWKSGGLIEKFAAVTANGSTLYLPLYSAPSSANRVDGLQGICNGRLTTESGVPISTADRTSQSTLYFTPFQGNLVSLYDGSVWKLYAFSEVSIALSGLTSGRPYDVWLYDNAGTLTLELLAWTDGTTRATALALQDGVYVKTGATTRRYLGTIYTTATTTTEDSASKRYVWNYYNQVPRTISHEAAGSSASYTTALTYRSAGGNNNVRCNVIAGSVGQVINLDAYNSWVCGSVQACRLAIAEDSTTSPSTNFLTFLSHNNGVLTTFVPQVTFGKSYVPLGFHFYQLVERQDTATSTTHSNGQMKGEWLC